MCVMVIFNLFLSSKILNCKWAQKMSFALTKLVLF